MILFSELKKSGISIFGDEAEEFITRQIHSQNGGLLVNAAHIIEWFINNEKAAATHLIPTNDYDRMKLAWHLGKYGIDFKSTKIFVSIIENQIQR